MYTVLLPRIGTDVAWRDAARRLIGAGILPADVLWDFGAEMEELFATAAPLPPVTRRIKARKALSVWPIPLSGTKTRNALPGFMRCSGGYGTSPA